MVRPNIRALKSTELLHRIYCAAVDVVVVVERYSLLVLMTHLHVDCNTKSFFRFHCVSKEFSLYIVFKHIGDEDVSDDHFLAVFEITVFCYLVKDTVEWHYRLALLLFSQKEDIAIKSDVPGSYEGYFHLFPKF